MNPITRKDEQITELFETLDQILSDLEKSFDHSKPPLNNEKYFTDKDVSERLKISRRTLQEYRNQGVISYIQLGGKILYRESDLQKLLEQNYYPAFQE